MNGCSSSLSAISLDLQALTNNVHEFVHETPGFNTFSGVFYAHFSPDFILRCTRMYNPPSFSMVHHVFGVQSCTFPRSAEFSAHGKGRGATPRPTIIVRGATPRFATMTVQRYAFYFRNPRIRVMKLRMTRKNGCLFKYRSKTAATMTATMNAM